MKINKLCDSCKKKCKVHTLTENTRIYCSKFEKVVNEQIELKIKLK